jgi:hypothetical protein
MYTIDVEKVIRAVLLGILSGLLIVLLYILFFIPSPVNGAERVAPQTITYHHVDNLTYFTPMPNLRIVCIWTERTDQSLDTRGYFHAESVSGLSCFQLSALDFETYSDKYRP